MEIIKYVWSCFVGYTLAMLIFRAYDQWSETRKKKDDRGRAVIDAFLVHLVYIRNNKNAIRIGDKVRPVTGGQDMYVFGIAPSDKFICLYHDKQHIHLKTFSPLLLQKVSDVSDQSDGKQSKED